MIRSTRLRPTGTPCRRSSSHTRGEPYVGAESLVLRILVICSAKCRIAASDPTHGGAAHPVPAAHRNTSSVLTSHTSLPGLQDQTKLRSVRNSWGTSRVILSLCLDLVIPGVPRKKKEEVVAELWATTTTQREDGRTCSYSVRADGSTVLTSVVRVRLVVSREAPNTGPPRPRLHECAPAPVQPR